MSALKACAVSLLLLAAAPVLAEEHEEIIIFDEDDEIIISDERPSDDPLAQLEQFFERYVYGTVGGIGFFGGSVNTNFAAAQIGIDYLYEEGPVPVRGVGEVIGSLREMEFDQVWVDDRPDSERMDGDPEDGDTRTIGVDETGFDIRQLYVEVEPVPNLLLRAGRDAPIWGQFDIISPVNFLLPIETQSNRFGLGKENYRMPQDNLSFNYFPVERLQVAGWYFPTITLDPLIERVVLEEYEFEDEAIRRATHNRFDDFDAFALRALYFADSFTFGLTYYDGHQSLAFFERRSLAPGDDDDPPEAGDDSRPDLPEITAVGLELTVPIGTWNWRTEFVYFQGDVELVCCEYGSGFNIVPGAPSNPSDPMDPFVRYYDWIREENGGNLFIETDQFYAAIGFDVQEESWSYGLTLLAIGTLLSGKADEAHELEEAAFPDDDNSSLESFQVAPSLYGIYRLDEEQNHTIGVAAGFLGPVIGVSGFYQGRWQDDIAYWLSLDYIQSLAVGLASESHEEEVDESAAHSAAWELEEDLSFGIRAGLTYSF